MAAYQYLTPGSREIKSNIASIPDKALDVVNAVEPRVYSYAKPDWKFPPGHTPKSLLDTKARHWGFIAEEIADAVEAVGITEFSGHQVIDDTHILNYSELLAVLWGGVRELSAQVNELRGHIGQGG
jgi:hypothetical protein